MSDAVIQRLALIFLAVAAALTSSLWAHDDRTLAPQRTADTTLAAPSADRDVRVSEPIGRGGIASPYAEEQPRHRRQSPPADSRKSLGH